MHLTHPQTTSENQAAPLDPEHPIARFIEQMGLLCESDGLPRIAGRFLGLLIVEDGPFSINELSERLQVSRASVSTNARMLAGYGVVERISRAGDRHDYYQLARDTLKNMLEGRLQSFQHAARVFQEAAESFPPDREEAKERVMLLADFHRTAARTIAQLIEGFVRPAEPASSTASPG